MDATQAADALQTRTDVRISRNLADKALLSAQLYGYYSIEKQDGSIIEIRHSDNGFTITVNY